MRKAQSPRSGAAHQAQTRHPVTDARWPLRRALTGANYVPHVNPRTSLQKWRFEGDGISGRSNSALRRAMRQVGTCGYCSFFQQRHGETGSSPGSQLREGGPARFHGHPGVSEPGCGARPAAICFVRL